MGFSLVSLLGALNRRSFASAGLRATTVDIDGGATTMRCWISDSLLTRSSEPVKPTLVLIHGFGPETTWQWRRQISTFSRHFSLILPDLVFFGGSTTRASDRSEAFQAVCVARLLDALGVSSRIAGVVGTSYGGFVAYHLASSLGPERVGRVVIASSDVLKKEDDDASLKERAQVEISDILLPQAPEHVRAVLALCVHRPPRFIPDFLLRDIINNVFSEKRDEKMELMKGIDLHKIQITPLPQDVLIVWGEHDGLFPLDKAHAVKKALGEKARLEIMEGTSHLPQMEDPETFNKLVLDFLLGDGSNHEHSTKA